MNAITGRNETSNVSEPERWASMAGGAGLVVYGLMRRDWKGLASAALGGMLVYRGATGHCDVFQALGISTRERADGVSIPYELGIRVDHSIEVARPRNEVFQFWRQFDNLPRFMQHLDEVTILDNQRSHWVADAPVGHVEWDAVIINEVPNELIGWRSLEGSDVDMAGSVHFADSGAGTRVSVELQYNPPAGSLGAVVARLLGEDPAKAIRQDMARFKQLMETGQVSMSKGPKKERAAAPSGGKIWNRDEVMRSSEESFPASDPPSWTPESL